MKNNSFTELIKSLDLIILRNRSSFSQKEYLVLEDIKRKLIEFDGQFSKSSKSQRQAMIQKLVIELLRVFSNSKLLNIIKEFF